MAVVDATLSRSSILSSVRSDIVARTRQGIDRKTHYVSGLLDAAYFSKVPHKHPFASGFIPGVNALDQYLGSSFKWSELDRALGRDYKCLLQPYFDFEPFGQGYKKDLQSTKVYVLTQKAEELLNQYWRANEAVDVIERKDGSIVKPCMLPLNGIVRTSFSDIVVPSLIALPIDWIDEPISRLEGLVTSGLGRMRWQARLRYLYRARKWLVSLGGLPNLYADYREGEPPHQGNGRLYGIGEFHLQTMKRSARLEIFRNTKWLDCDFAACHPTIFMAVARSLGCETEWLEEYIEHRGEIHLTYQDEQDIPVKKMKPVFNGLLFGQRLSQHGTSSLRQLLGRTGVKALQRDAFYLVLRDEIKRNTAEIIAAHTTGTNVVNAVGKQAVKSEHGQASLLSHILTGYEASILNAVCKTRSSIKVIMHDGWVDSDSVDASAVEHEIATFTTSQFGFSIPLKLKVVKFD